VTSVVVRTGSRLHLGLLGLPGAAGAALWPDLEGNESVPGRSFGGAGLMIEEPAIAVRVRRTAEWTARGPSSSRALAWARQIAGDRSPLAVNVDACPEAHVGFGTGTQLALAVGTAVAQLLGTNESPHEIACRLSRGLRSGLGLHGFIHGGFVVDGGKGTATQVAPLVCRHPFPPDWRILLVRPREQVGLSGTPERDAFARLALDEATRRQTESLCRLVVLGLVPALVERDLDAFGEALYDFNRRAGILFKASQGGIYASPAVAELVKSLREAGIRGVGQSSWGPTVFAIGDADRLAAVAADLTRRFPTIECSITWARNQGHAATK
jgi:beta-RFAP synthase